jgi:hypothetical protein
MAGKDDMLWDIRQALIRTEEKLDGLIHALDVAYEQRAQIRGQLGNIATILENIGVAILDKNKQALQGGALEIAKE